MFIYFLYEVRIYTDKEVITKKVRNHWDAIHERDHAMVAYPNWKKLVIWNNITNNWCDIAERD